MSAKLHTLLKYPLLIPKTHDLNELEGYINVRGHDYKVHVHNRNGTVVLAHSDFDPPNLGVEHSDITQYLDALCSALSASASPQPTNTTDHYRHVLNEFVEFRQFYINLDRCVLSHDLSNITITTADESARKHRLTISTNASFQITEHDLPDRRELLTPSPSLSVVYEKFLETLAQLQPFFDVMDALDNAWILDPEHPTTKHSYRRIAIDHNVSLIVTVDPWMCNDVPQLQLLGPERLVEKFRTLISKNLSKWNTKSNPVDELLNLLEMETFLPKQACTDDATLYKTGDCCICFSSRLEGKLPEIICKNPSCEQCFHTDCLYQWLVSVGAKTKQWFNEVYGHCPNCEKHISCPIP